MRIIDIAAVYGQQNTRERSFTEPEQLISFMDRYGLTDVVACNARALNDNQRGNADAVKLVQEAGDRVMAAFILDMLIGDGRNPSQDAANLYDYLNEEKPAAIRMFPKKQSWRTMHPFYLRELFAVLQELQIPVMWDSHAKFVEYYPDIFTQFPQLRAILLRFPQAEARYFLPLMRQFPHVYTDTSKIFDFGAIEHYVNLFGAERILFAGGIPQLDPTVSLSNVICSKLRQEDKEKILGLNFLRMKEETRWAK